jgi:hypothetical protein
VFQRLCGYGKLQESAVYKAKIAKHKLQETTPLAKTAQRKSKAIKT